MFATHRRPTSLVLVLLLGACSEAPLPTALATQRHDAATARAAEPRGSAHTVVGSALTEGLGSPPGMPFEFSWSLAAHQSTTGAVRGKLTIKTDFTMFGLGSGVAQIDIDCLVVDGNTAWFSGLTAKATKGLFIPIPDPVIGWVQDNGPGSADFAYFGPTVFWAPGQTCVDRPPLPAQLLVRGNFVVR